MNDDALRNRLPERTKTEIDSQLSFAMNFPTLAGNLLNRDSKAFKLNSPRNFSQRLSDLCTSGETLRKNDRFIAF